MAPYNRNMTLPTAVLAVNSIGLVLSFLAVALRTYARVSRKIKWRLCDYTIIIAWVFGLGLVISENYCVIHGGIGQKTAEVSAEELVFAIKQFIVIGVTGTLAVTFVKVSLLDFFVSIFSVQTSFQVVAYLLMGITVSYGISFTIVTLAGCQPFEANWDKPSYPDYKCINTSKFYVAQAAINAFLDISILLLPIPAVWTLKLKRSKKIALTFVFAIGILICGITLVRLYYNTNQTFMLTHFTEYAGIAVILGALEVNLTIICTCLPTLPTLVSTTAERIRSSLQSFYTKQYYDTPSKENSLKLISWPHRSRRGFIPAGDSELDVARSGDSQDRLQHYSATDKTQVDMQDHGARLPGTNPAIGMQTGRNYSHAWKSGPNSSNSPRTRGEESTDMENGISVTKKWAIH